MAIRSLTELEKNRVKSAFKNPSEVVNLETSEELHQFAWFYNWDDDNLEPLYWIISNPICDKGTALLLFWYSEPRYLYNNYANESEVDSQDVEVYRFVKSIEVRFLAGFYVKQNISFDPHKDGLHDLTLDDVENKVKQEIPVSMLNKTPGEIAVPEIF